MLGGGGKSSGMINEATNHLTNERLTATIQEMAGADYQRQRALDTTDVIPTHQHLLEKHSKSTGDEHLEVFAVPQKRGEGDDDDDDDLAALRASRRQQLKKDVSKAAEWRQKLHGTYREIGQDDFFGVVVREKGGSENAAVHFYHADFESCKLMDRHLSELAPRMMSVRFVKVNVAKTPFLVEKLRITVLPCVVLFKDDVAVDRIVGFDDFGSDEFDPELLRTRLEQVFVNGQ